MKLRQLFSGLLCSSLLLTGALAAQPLISPAPTSGEETGGTAQTADPVTLRVWGTLTKLEDGSLRLQNSGEMDGVINDIILRGESILYLDAVTGDPITEDDLREGEMVYAYVLPQLAESDPPQGTAVIVLAHIPADFGVPSYYEITNTMMISTLMIEGNAINLTLSTDQGIPLSFALTDKLDEEGNREYILKDEITLFRYQSDEALSVTDLVPGTRILVWLDQQGEISKVMAFPYDYAGYLTVLDNGSVLLNGTALDTAALTGDGEALLPLRCVCEALGLTVRWDSEARAAQVETADGTVLFTYAMDTGALEAGGEALTLSVPARNQDGSLYFAQSDLAGLLDLYETV